MISGSPDGADGTDPEELRRYFVKHGRYTAGTITRYKPSVICAEPKHAHLAEGFVTGMRFHSAPVVRLADAKVVQLGHTVKADGRWRIFAFCGREDPAASSSQIARLCEFLAQASQSPVRRYTAANADIDSVIDVRAVFQQRHQDLRIEAMPAFLLPEKGRYGLRDYEKMFCPDLKNGPDIFDLRGIARENGCMVVVRPDQYIANILPLDAYAELSAFFDRFMLTRSDAAANVGQAVA